MLNNTHKSGLQTTLLELLYFYSIFRCFDVTYGAGSLDRMLSECYGAIRYNSTQHAFKPHSGTMKQYSQNTHHNTNIFIH